MKIKVEAKSIYKIFGPDPASAQRLLAEGRGKDEIFEQTGNTVGVQDASFQVGEGQIFVVMGLSGSGKSTLVRMINGLITPTSGEMLIDGIDIASCSAVTLRDVRRSKIAMVFQHFALFPHRTVAENVAFGLKVKGVGVQERRAKAEDALGQVGLTAYADSYPDELSGGMQQRVGLARGLASNAEILLMDEPFSALDPLIRRDMQDELVQLQRTLKKTIIFITHDLNEALILGDKIAIMKDGQFVQTGTAEEIVDRPADEYVAAFTADIDRSRVFTAATVAAPAEALDAAHDTNATALQRMEALGRDAIHVTDGGTILGLVTYRDIAASLRNGGGGIRDSIIADYPCADGSSHLNELYPLAERGLPIAVTDKEGRFAGVLAPEDLFAKLAVPASA